MLGFKRSSDKMEPRTTSVAVDRFSINMAIGNSVGAIDVFPISLGFSFNDLQGNESSFLSPNTTSFTIQGHSNDVLGLSFGLERDHVILASSGYDGKVILWRFNLCSWEPETIYSSDFPITSVSFSSEFQHSRYLAFIDINRKIYVYNTITKEVFISYSDIIYKPVKGRHKISFIPYTKGETEDSSLIIASTDGKFYIFDISTTSLTLISTPDFQNIDDIFQVSAYSSELFAAIYHSRSNSNLHSIKLRIVDISNSCQDIIQSRANPDGKSNIEALCVNWMLGSRTLAFIFRVSSLQRNGSKVTEENTENNEANVNDTDNEEETNEEEGNNQGKRVSIVKGRRLVQDYDKKWKVPILKSEDKEFDELKAAIGFKAKHMCQVPKNITDNLFRRKKLQNIK